MQEHCSKYGGRDVIIIPKFLSAQIVSSLKESNRMSLRLDKGSDATYSVECRFHQGNHRYEYDYDILLTNDVRRKLLKSCLVYSKDDPPLHDLTIYMCK